MTQKKVIARLKRITTKERFSIARKLKRKGFHMKQKSSFLLLLLFLMFSSNGCSLIGYGIGSAIDSGQPQKYKYKKIGELQSGDRMRVIRRDSTIIEGRYKGMAADGML
ncbi:MAG: hypothetical protein GWN00_10940, partial [Aliifodinibius sp.]|nr:hypothetical protein [Fodinibius sp.]NIV12453.1 hypothetical protein [Fodinibius sp.]NIY25301.1 hypothetical protein [Fodinibius sp.]